MLRKEEMLGIAVAIAAHAALVAGLMMQPSKRQAVRPPERMTVSFAPDVALSATSPNPSMETQASIGAQLAEVPAPPIPEPVTPPIEQRVTPRQPPAPPKAQPRPTPKPTSRPSPRTQPTSRPAPRATAAPRPAPAPAPRAAPSPAASARSTPAPRPTQAARTGGASRIGDSFLDGTSDGARNAATTAPAANFGPSDQAALGSAIGRQLKRHWASPQGVDVERLVTNVRFRLAKDGSLIGEPQIISQSGKTAANASQVQRHAEQAIRAVKLAAPFNLPEQFYDYWKTVDSRFDRNLSR